jgi:hypothetical protein
LFTNGIPAGKPRRCSLAAAGRFSTHGRHCGECLAGLRFWRDIDLLHHTPTGTTWIDPALHLTRRQNLYFAAAVPILTQPALPLLKSHENCSFLRCGPISAIEVAADPSCDRENFLPWALLLIKGGVIWLESQSGEDQGRRKKLVGQIHGRELCACQGRYTAAILRHYGLLADLVGLSRPLVNAGLKSRTGRAFRRGRWIGQQAFGSELLRCDEQGRAATVH